MTRVQTNGLQVAPVLHDFIEREALAGTGVTSAAFWSGLAGLVRDFAPRDRALLAVRDKLQAQIDEYHRNRAGKPFDQTVANLAPCSGDQHDRLAHDGKLY